MMESLSRLINALRDELQQYGEMLALLDRQQQFVITRAAEEVLESVRPIQTQASAIQEARAHREECRRLVAQDSQQTESTAFSVLIPLLPPDYRPLVKALVEENNELLVRVRQRARQNHVLLSRSLEFMQTFLNTLLPARETRVYNDHGNPHTHVIATRPLYEAVG
jgi:flagellar biosynthesis/type III secretory pathway chaperone